MQLKSLFVQLMAAAPVALAHPHGAHEPLHMAKPLPRGLGHCHAHFERSNLSKRTAERHLAEVDTLKKERGLEHLPTIHRRQFGGFPGFGGGDPAVIADILGKSHKSDKDVTVDTDPAELFADAGSCVLSPEVTEGPSRWASTYMAKDVRGEQIRRDVTDGEGGVKMRLAIQVVDVETCDPIPDAWVDLWSCNSTGVYGGVLYYPGNGDPNDESIINATALRGVQPTDADGIALFDSLYPAITKAVPTTFTRGPRVSKAKTFCSLAMVHHGVTQNENGTITGGRVSHIGQMYVDDDLLDIVEKTSAYAINTQPWTRNDVDILFGMGTAGGDDPILRYAMLGDDIENGIFAWIRFGIDSSATRNYNPAAYKDETGGHQNPTGPVQPGGMGGGLGGGFGGGFLASLVLLRIPKSQGQIVRCCR
ncbi:unnamed protein product [Parascedosporium putredinis]|uniref:Aromatic compound dioxygenase n=1 Tax=Parascedosporium putredinis TaxID=1442378 RepID=A0A9P1H3Q6_9PEZI|nr:unnamed protein product [Parascedosporium putredinis]CAI7994926.1 unnamed protein product [Parascedosporium putredinis]